MLPDGWQYREIGDLLTLEYGDGLPQRERTGQGYPVYGSSGVIGKHSESLVESPGIIVGRKGTVGAVVWSSKDFWPIDTTYYVRLKEKLEFRWLYWMLLHSKLGRLDASTGVPGLNRYEAYAVTAPVPPLPEQRRIAEILDAADEAIRQTERVIAKLREVKKGLLHDLLTRGLDADGNLRDPDAHPEQFKDSPLGRIPREWELRELATTAVSGGFVDGDWIESEWITDKGIRLIQTGNIGIGKFVERPEFSKFITLDSFKQLGCRWVYPGDLLISRLADPAGRTCQVPPRLGKSVTAVDCTIFRPNEKILTRRFALHFLNSRHFLERVANLASGSTRQRISRSNLGSLEIPMPSLPEQHRIAAVLDAHDARIRAEEATLDKLRQVKRGLMDDLLTGRVRVG
jgi:type I restriction enzyme S subunit